MGTWEQDSPPTPRLPEYSSRIYVLDSYYPWLRRGVFLQHIHPPCKPLDSRAQENSIGAAFPVRRKGGYRPPKITVTNSPFIDDITFLY